MPATATCSGFRRDLLTAAAYGVDQFLFVYGDEPLAGARTSELNVRTMLTEGRAYADTLDGSGQASRPSSGRHAGGRHAGGPSMRFGATSGLRPLPAWKQAADFLCVQVGFSLDDLLAWRSTVDGGRSRLRRGHRDRQRRHGQQLHHPGTHRARRTSWRGLEKDRNAGVDAACDLVVGIRDSGAFEGVHLIPVARYREVAARLERDLASG